MRRAVFSVAGITMVTFFVACAGPQVPSRQIMRAQSITRAAEESGARDNPQASLHLQLAQEELARANKLIDKRQNREAIRMLARAEVDGQLAQALARQSSVQLESQQTLEKVQRLREQLNLPAGTSETGVHPQMAPQ